MVLSMSKSGSQLKFTSFANQYIWSQLSGRPIPEQFSGSVELLSGGGKLRLEPGQPRHGFYLPGHRDTATRPNRHSLGVSSHNFRSPPFVGKTWLSNVHSWNSHGAIRKVPWIVRFNRQPLTAVVASLPNSQIPGWRIHSNNLKQPEKQSCHFCLALEPLQVQISWNLCVRKLSILSLSWAHANPGHPRSYVNDLNPCASFYSLGGEASFAWACSSFSRPLQPRPQNLMSLVAYECMKTLNAGFESGETNSRCFFWSFWSFDLFCIFVILALSARTLDVWASCRATARPWRQSIGIVST